MIRAFLSFVEEDLNRVNLFRGQAKNDNLDLEFADFSLKTPFDSTNSDYIKRGITSQLIRASITVCLYGPTTYTSKWVDWELGKSLELGKPIMGVCLYNDNGLFQYPRLLEGRPRLRWDINAIVKTMRQIAPY